MTSQIKRRINESQGIQKEHLGRSLHTIRVDLIRGGISVKKTSSGDKKSALPT